MTNKTRLNKIAENIKPPSVFMAIWEDRDRPGVFYNKGNNEPDRVQVDPVAIRARAGEKLNLFMISYARTG